MQIIWKIEIQKDKQWIKATVKTKLDNEIELIKYAKQLINQITNELSLNKSSLFLNLKCYNGYSFPFFLYLKLIYQNVEYSGNISVRVPFG